MIAGAHEIICGVDAGVVNPLLLPAAQGEETYAYIVITYDDFPEVFDILFVKGSRVSEYASLHHELRAILGVQSVEMLLTACGKRCRVYLFSVSREGFERFLRTFYFEPTLNVVINRLSRKQISCLLTDSGCRNGILEVDCPGLPLPEIELCRFHSEQELLREASRFRRGRLSLYDMDLNSAIRQRMAMLQGGVPGSHADLEEADPPRDAPAGDPGTNADQGTNVAPVEPETLNDDSVGAGETDRDPAPDPAVATAPGIDGTVTPSPGPGEDEFVPLFRDVLEEFTGLVKVVYKNRFDGQIQNLLCREFNCPEGFDPALIDDKNALQVMTVIEEGIAICWSFRRKHLRECAREIVKTLYESHNEVLQRHGAAERVQKCFRELES